MTKVAVITSHTMKMTVERTSHPENGLGLIFSLMFRVFFACSYVSTKIQAHVLIKLVVTCTKKGFYLTNRNCSFLVGISC